MLESGYIEKFECLYIYIQGAFLGVGLTISGIHVMGTEVFLPTSQAGVTRLVHNEGYIIREINVKKYIMNYHYSNDSMDTDSYQKSFFTFFIRAKNVHYILRYIKGE